MTATGSFARGDPIAVRQQDREAPGVAFHADAVFGQHVGPVGEEGDAAETLGLTLGAEHPVRRIKAHQLGVGGRADFDLGLDRGVIVRHLDDELLAVEAMRDVGTVELHRNQLEVAPVEAQRPGVLAVPFNGEGRAHSRALGVEIELEADLRHQPIGRAIILAADRQVRR